jgi:NADPH-dependent 2,4-dienoyl-CoA reductase/sulfur reductase-like enzyme
LALASHDYAANVWTKYQDIPALKDVHCIQGSVTSIDAKKRLAVIEETQTLSVSERSYDFLVAASGMRRVWPVVPQSRTRESYLNEVGAHIEAVKNAKDGVVVIGGGEL